MVFENTPVMFLEKLSEVLLLFQSLWSFGTTLRVDRFLKYICLHETQERPHYVEHDENIGNFDGVLTVHRSEEQDYFFEYLGVSSNFNILGLG